jgi:hypothetical protein
MKLPSAPRFRVLASPALALLVGAACALWLLYPAWLDPEQVLVGDWRHPDVLSNHWLYGWLRDQLATGGGILHNDRYYFPVGDAPWLAGNGGDGLLFAALGPRGAWPGSVTAWLLGVLTLNGAVAFGLCRQGGASRAGALLGAAILGACGYLAHELSGGRFAQAALWPLLGFAWAWLSLLERPRWLPAVAAAAALALSFQVYLVYGLWALGLASLLLMARLAWGPGSAWGALRGLGRPGLGFLGLALPLCAVVLWPTLAHWSAMPGVGEGSWPHPLAVEASLPLTGFVWAGGADRAEVLPPLLGLILAGWAALVGLRGAQRDWRVLGLLVFGLAFALLALGPRLLLPGGEPTGIPGPFGLIYGWLGPLRRFWWPYRHVVGVLIPVAFLAARGFDMAMARWRLGAGWLAAVGLVALLPLDSGARGGRVGAASSWWEPPPAYRAIAELPGDAMLELPLAPVLVSTQQSLSYQQLHGKALVNGHAAWVARVRPEAWDAWVDGNTFLRMLRAHELGLHAGPFAFLPEHVLALHEQGVRLLVVNREYLPGPLYSLADSYETIFTQLFGPPVYRFRDHIAVWDTARYTMAGFVDIEPFQLPIELQLADGSAAAAMGHSRALGLRGLSRAFPPQLPPEEAPEGPVEGGSPAPHQATGAP